MVRVMKTTNLEQAKEIIKLLEDNLEGKISIRGNSVIVNAVELNHTAIQTLHNIMHGYVCKVTVSKKLIIKIEL